MQADTDYSRDPVLFAKDDTVSRIFLEKTIGLIGYKFATVENGVQALAAFREQFFPILVTDWMMPEMDGPIRLCYARKEDFFLR